MWEFPKARILSDVETRVQVRVYGTCCEALGMMGAFAAQHASRPGVIKLATTVRGSRG